MKNTGLTRIACIALAFCVAALSASAQTFTIIVSFNGFNGEEPYFGSLSEDTNGNIYGTTLTGGPGTICNNGQGYGCGEIFEVASDGTFSTLYNFCSVGACADGLESFGGLAHDSAGNLYGTTATGGTTFGGTVFKITTAGVLTTLYNFCSQTGCTDGSAPSAGLVSLGGNFYGTTSSGGANGFGTVFEITPEGQLTTLYSLCSQTNCADGNLIYDALIEANGKLWGVTESGGANGLGTVFSITPAGKFTTVHSFNNSDGANPFGSLLHAANGNIYGTTSEGGTFDDGTVFKITAAGKLTTLYNFCVETDCTDGAVPLGGLVRGKNGSFYGVTGGGGRNFRGTIFEITATGRLTTLYSFCSETNCADGENPYAGLIQATDGKLYGTTLAGGDLSCGSPNGCGTVFSFKP